MAILHFDENSYNVGNVGQSVSSCRWTLQDVWRS